MPIGAANVGERLKVFSQANGAKFFKKCVIEAHGEQRFFDKDFVLPAGKTVVFYVPQGHAQRYDTIAATMDDAEGTQYTYSNALAAIASGKAQAHESYPPQGQDASGQTACPDYNLQKIQRSVEGCAGGAHSNWAGSRYAVTYSDLADFATYHRSVCCDIVTIRYRRFKLAITLSEVINELISNNHDYDEFRCSFCRVKPNSRKPTESPVRGAKIPAALGGGTY